MSDRKPSLRVAPENASDNDALAELQNEVERLKNDQNEVRFLLIVIIIVLGDALIFTRISNWAGALVIGIIEIFGIAVLARRLRIEEVPQMLSKFLDRTAERVNPPAVGSSPTVQVAPTPTHPPPPPAPPSLIRRFLPRRNGERRP